MMSSRLKQDPEKMFDVFIEFVREAAGHEGQGRVVRFFPEDFVDEEVLKPSLKFAFPYSFGRHRYTEEYFTFVMTDINSKFKFGFCKLVFGPVERNYCFISCLPWFDSFYSVLDEISSRLARHDQDAASTMLSLLHQVLPSLSPSITCLTPPNWIEKFNFVYPTSSCLSSIPNDRNFSELFSTFRASSLMILFASMLFERRVLLYGSSIAKVTSCIHGMNQLIYPMCWQHLFIPILPPSLIDYCSAPMPYIIGLHSSTMMRLKKMEYSDAVLVNVDENKVHTEHLDLPSIPQDVVATLKKNLKNQKSLLDKNQPIGNGVSKAFLGAMVSLIGGYRNAMRFHDGADITFDPDVFVAGASFTKDPSLTHEYKRFFGMILHMQLFQQFINDRLDIMNAGRGFQDEFDKAVIMMSGDEDRWKTQSRYKEWLAQMKKQGKMLKREGKDKWTMFASKVKHKSKKTWKELKSRLDEMKKDDVISAHHKHPTAVFHYKPPRPPPPSLPKDVGIAIKSSILRRTSLERTQHYDLLDVDMLESKNKFIDESDEDLNYLHRVDIDLSNDPDLRTWMARPSRHDIASDMSHWFRKSYSVEGLCNAKSEKDKNIPSTLDTSIDSDVNDVQMNTRSFSSANMIGKVLEGLDLSSIDSNSTDIASREGSGVVRRNDTSNNLQSNMTTSFSSMFRSNTSNEFVTHSQEQLRAEIDSILKRRENRSGDDLMNFDSSNSSIEFDPLKQKLADASYIDHLPVPFPRYRSRNVPLGSGVDDETDEGDNKNVENKSALPPPLPMPRKRDTTSIQYYHHRKQIYLQQPTNFESQVKTQKVGQDHQLKVSNSNLSDQPTNSNVDSIEETTSFENERKSLAKNMKEARAAFLQSDCNVQMSQLGLESFDPLVSGQLVIEPPNKSPSHQKSDEELLKDWDLFDINKTTSKYLLLITSAASTTQTNDMSHDNATPGSNTFRPVLVNSHVPLQRQFVHQPTFTPQSYYVCPRPMTVVPSTYRSTPVQFLSTTNSCHSSNLSSSSPRRLPSGLNVSQKSSTLPHNINQNNLLNYPTSENNLQVRHGKVWETFD